MLEYVDRFLIRMGLLGLEFVKLAQSLDIRCYDSSKSILTENLGLIGLEF